MDDSIFDILSVNSKQKLIKEPQPAFIEPMLATLVQEYFSNENWLYEQKWDGYRILAYRNKENIKLLTRNLIDYTDSFPEVANSLKNQKCDNFILDGEVIAIKDYKHAFEFLQRKRLIKDSVKVVYCLFDIIYLNGYSLMNLELIDRKKLLEKAITIDKTIESLKITDYIIKYGLEYYTKACNMGWEGILAKKISSTYVTRRSADWLKFKCSNQQEFIVIGYTKPTGLRMGFGSLLLGYYENGKLCYAGNVGTGFSEYLLLNLFNILEQLEQKASPLDEDTKEIRKNLKDIHWVQPKIVVEVRFTEWTKDGKLRHPSFLRIRIDKDPKSVVREAKI